VDHRVGSGQVEPHLRDLLGLGHLQEARIAADLAQLEQRIKENDVALGETLSRDFLAHLLVPES
jgi:hypothetical protein